MSKLDEIFVRNGTDKGSTHPVKGHGYAPYYEFFLNSYRYLPIKFMEIGVGGGESVRSWLEYFTSARIYGVDLVHDTNPWNTPGAKPDPRYTFVHNNQSDPVGWACFLADHGGDWDVIIDDGSHMAWDVITTHDCLWPFLKPGGLYVVEDLEAAFTPGSIFVRPGAHHGAWLAEHMRRINTGEGDVAGLWVVPGLAVLIKKE